MIALLLVAKSDLKRASVQISRLWPKKQKEIRGNKIPEAVLVAKPGKQSPLDFRSTNRNPAIYFRKVFIAHP